MINIMVKQANGTGTKMDLGEIIQTLSLEMGVRLEAKEQTVQLGEGVTGARLYQNGQFYGAVVLITDEAGNLKSCAYLGEYLGQTGIEKPGFGKRDKICLGLDTREAPVSKEGNLRLVRVDHNSVVFLGKRQNGWGAYEKNCPLGPAVGYAKMLFERQS